MIFMSVRFKDLKVSSALCNSCNSFAKPSASYALFAERKDYNVSITIFHCIDWISTIQKFTANYKYCQCS